jgi:hypothetical protein
VPAVPVALLSEEKTREVGAGGKSRHSEILRSKDPLQNSIKAAYFLIKKFLMNMIRALAIEIHADRNEVHRYLEMQALWEHGKSEA